jgi:hypothetical protein
MVEREAGCSIITKAAIVGPWRGAPGSWRRRSFAGGASLDGSVMRMAARRFGPTHVLLR